MYLHVKKGTTAVHDKKFSCDIMHDDYFQYLLPNIRIYNMYTDWALADLGIID